MNIYKKNILNNICYTELVYGRINKKLDTNLSKNEIEKFIFETIEKTSENNFKKKGKNIYVLNSSENIIITINSNNFRIITVNRID